MSEAVVQLHKYNIAHRDITIDNYFVNSKLEHPELNIQLGDFELVNFLGEMNSDYSIDYFDPDNFFLVWGTLTLGFAPKDQFWARSVVNQEMDQSALALVLTHVLSGGKFDPRIINPKEINARIKEAIVDKYGEKTLQILLKATSEKPESRYRSVLQFRVALISTIVKHFRTEA